MTRTYPPPLPVQTTTFDPTSIPQPLKHDFGDDIQFLGYDFAPDLEQAIVNLTLYWRSVNPVPENYRTRVQLIGPDGQPHFTWLSHPLNGRYPTRAWDRGDVIRDELPLPLAAVPPNSYSVEINLLHQAEDIPLADKPLTIVRFELPTAQPIANASTLGEIDYRLWNDNTPARYRQTLPLSWAYRPGPESIQNPKPALSEVEGSEIRNLNWALLGPDNVPRPPAAAGDATAIFIVEADWPSGDYRLQLQNGSESRQTGPVLAVANHFRLFALPVDAATRAGWTPVEANFATPQGQLQVKLLGYNLPARRVEPGGGLPLTLYWQSSAPVLADIVTFAVLLDAEQQPYGSVDRYPSGFYSPILWARDEVVIDNFTVPIQADAPPGVYSLHLGQYQVQDGQSESLPLVHEGELTDATAVVIGPIKIGGPPPAVVTRNPTPQTTLNQPLGNQITLLGYDLTDQANQPIQSLSSNEVKGPKPHQTSPGQGHASEIRNPKSKIRNLRLTLYWQAETDLQTDYTTFLHLRNAANETVAQKDNPPAAGRYPTSLWNAGEIVVDEIILPLDELPPGQYRPVAGLYESATGARLTVPGVPANEIALEPIELKE